MLRDISDSLVALCESIIAEQELTLTKNPANEYSKNGKKYKLTSTGDFVRVHDESKHLLVSETYQGFQHNYSILSSYHILQNCGQFLSDYRRLALAIIFTSREVELNKWYDETSKVASIDNCTYDPFNVEKDALRYIADVNIESRTQLVELGTTILTATKINYFQTDHNVTTPTLEGYALRKIIMDNCGNEALKSIDVYNALRAFSHWCSIRGIFYKLSIPNLRIDLLLKRQFNSFPLIPIWVADSVHGRYPAGCSKIALIKKSLNTISQSVYGRLTSVPANLNIRALLKLCHDIETDPLTYRIYSSTTDYSTNGHLDVNALFTNANAWIEYVSCILQAIGNYRMPFENKLLVSNKILKVAKVKDKQVYKQTWDLVRRVQMIERSANRDVSDEKLVSMMGGEVVDSIASYYFNRNFD